MSWEHVLTVQRPSTPTIYNHPRNGTTRKCEANYAAVGESANLSIEPPAIREKEIANGAWLEPWRGLA
jgi:hypothetical protein